MFKENQKFENTLSPEQELIVLLNTNGIENEMVRNKLIAYQEQCERDAEAKISANPEENGLANSAQIVAAITMAKLYAQTDKREYKEYALESLYEIKQGEDNLNERIQKEIQELITKLELQGI